MKQGPSRRKPLLESFIAPWLAQMGRSNPLDARNRLVSVMVRTQITKFIHEGRGSRVKKINPDLHF